MRTFLISGSDTDAGKTHVVGALARIAARAGLRVQIVKPYQSGVSLPETFGDAPLARQLSGATNVETFTLRSFQAPLGPLCAALAEGKDPELLAVIDETRRLPVCDVRLIESAGGLAVPLNAEGFDWADFAHAIGVDAAFLVVPDRLGAIHQARATLAYARAKNLACSGIVLNETKPCEDNVRESNRARLRDCNVPVWGELSFGREDILLSVEAAKRLLS